MLLIVGLFLISFVFAVSMTGSAVNNESEENQNTETNVIDNSQKICCHIFGYGNQMRKVNSHYQWMGESSCQVPENFVGGGREIVDNKYCEVKAVLAKKVIQETNRIRANAKADECPENCICDGSTTTCRLNNSREMTIRAGNSGNTIVQVKDANMSTKVTLYKSEGNVYGVFRNNQTKIIKVMPDEIKEKIKQRIKARLEEHNITLDEDGIYQVQARKRARLFFMFPVKEKIKIQMNSETGEIIRTRTSWWGFLAKDVKDDSLEDNSE